MECIDEDSADATLVVEKIEESLRMAMEEDDRAGGTGPWVGLLEFSQGGKIAASLMLRQQHEHVGLSASLPAFRFCVLVAAPVPLVWLAPSPDHAVPRKSSPESILQSPTVHVYGKRDSLVSSPHDWLYQSCSPESRKLFVWDGDHFMPTRTGDVSAVVKMITELLDNMR